MTATVLPPRQRPARSRAKPLARLALAGVAIYVAIDVLLAFLRPAYSLIYNAESDYGRGPWYWVMDINFLLRCALSLAIAGALYRVVRPGDGTRGGLVLLVTWAISSGLLAFFADDLEGQPLTFSGIVHLVLAFIAFTCIAIGAILISASLMSDPAWRPAAPVLLAISIAGAVAYLLLGTALTHQHAPGGLYERVFLGLELLWIAVAAITITRRSRTQPGEQRL
jgi:drug/metabolite transporter (DMT)-like permease